jgi:hypothetical protein
MPMVVHANQLCLLAQEFRREKKSKVRLCHTAKMMTVG